jgi:hypothetical protein
MDGFNLYREAKEQYEKLIPDKTDGLVLISLFSKYREGSFSEINIISVINKVFKDQGVDSSRTEYYRNNSIILRLQESFLWRNDTKKTYQFKKYGVELCKSIEKRLIQKYNPAKIKRFFSELHRSLVENIESQGNYNEWITDHFDLRMPELVSQIEILDQQVNDSVSDFKYSIKTGNADILDVLKEIEIRLEIIKEQASELKNAFQISYDIDEILITILESGQGVDYLENIQKVQSFHDSSRNQLEQVSRRIEKIKPRIREFIYDFNKQDFDRKTNNFIRYLLSKSIVKRDGGNKRIVFPNNIDILKIKSTDTFPRFTVVPIRDISPKLPSKIQRKQIDLEKQTELLEKTARWKNDKERITYWTNEALNEIENKGILIYSPLFFKILEFDRLEIAVKTTHNIIRKIGKHHRLRLNIQIIKEPIFSDIKKGISIWQMTITKK